MTDHELQAINELLTSIYSDAYVSPIKKYEVQYYSSIDFQSYDFQLGVSQMERFILELNRSEFVENIESIIIR